MMRALLLGSAGMLAHDLIAEAPPEVEVIAPPKQELDITNESALRAALTTHEPDIVINAAAYTDVDGAESNRDLAFKLNAEAVAGIGSVCAQRSADGALVVHFSTDYVFNGRSERPYREDDPPEPLGVYGASKLAGEEALARSGARHLIVRTSWLFGLNGKSFPRTMWERAREGKETRVVSDQVGRPTFTVDLARAVWGVAPGVSEGVTAAGEILHIANGGTATWFDIAKRVFEAAGMPELVSPCATEEYPTPAQRPAYSVLDTSRYESVAGAPLPPWEDAVDRFLEGLRGEGSTPRTVHAAT